MLPLKVRGEQRNAMIMTCCECETQWGRQNLRYVPQRL